MTSEKVVISQELLDAYEDVVQALADVADFGPDDIEFQLIQRVDALKKK